LTTESSLLAATFVLFGANVAEDSPIAKPDEKIQFETILEIDVSKFDVTNFVLTTLADFSESEN
jgi:hypothetical protein